MEINYNLYKHTSPDGKTYIGITTKSLEQRSGKYGDGYRRNDKFWQDIIKIGWENFTHEVLFENLSEDYARVLERAFIFIYKSNNPEFGYNTTSGGEISGILGKSYNHTEDAKRKISESRKGFHHSDDAKKKMSDAKQGKYLGEENPMFGKHHSDEARQKMSEARKTIVYTEEWCSNLSIALSGENNPMFGKHHSDEARQKMSDTAREHNKGRHWYTNGIENKFDYECPEGFYPGKIQRK